MKKIKAWARKLKRQTLVLYLAYKDKRVPWYAKWFTAIVVAYALSPIDLIPDFIPVLGYLDDIILVPLGIALALKMLPDAVIADCEKEAEERLKNEKPKNWWAGSVVFLVWAAAAIWLSFVFFGD